MPEKPVNNSSVDVTRFAAELRALRTAAGLPSFRVMAGKAHFAPSTLAEATREGPILLLFYLFDWSAT